MVLIANPRVPFRALGAVPRKALMAFAFLLESIPMTDDGVIALCLIKL
jgi:hypothetical protein